MAGSEQSAGDECRAARRLPQILSGGVLDTHGNREKQNALVVAPKDRGEADCGYEESNFRNQNDGETPVRLKR